MKKLIYVLGIVSLIVFSLSTAYANDSEMSVDLLPKTDSTRSLGSTSLRWLKGWYDELTSGTLTMTSGSITDSSGAISFDNENLLTTGTLTLSGATLPQLTLGLDDTTNTAGSLKLIGAGANNYSTTFTTGTQVTNSSYTLPLAPPATFPGILSSTIGGVMSWLAIPLTVANGGTGKASFTTYMPICGGTTTTALLQSVATGTQYYPLCYNTSASKPTFQILDARGGGTGRVTYTAYALKASGATTTAAETNIANGATGTLLRYAGTNAYPAATTGTWTDGTGTITLSPGSGSGDLYLLSSSGKIGLGGTGNTNNESILFDCETTPDTVNLSSTTGVANIDLTGIMIKSTGTGGVSLPYGSFSSAHTHTVASTSVAYAISYSDDEFESGVVHDATIRDSKIYINTTGTYLITFSAVCKSSVANKTLDIWLAIDGVNVDRSNTVSKFVGAGNERIITVTYIYKFTAGQYLEVYYNGDDTNITIIATNAQVSPTRPACPSIILTVNMISKD
jgi:hypothetical protein